MTYPDVNNVLSQEVQQDLTSGSWHALNLNKIVPQDILSLISSAASMLDDYLKVALVAINVAEAAEEVFAVTVAAVADAYGVLVKGLVDIIEGFLQAGKVHLLFIPIPKQLGKDGVATPPTVPSTLNEIAYSLGMSLTDSDVAGLKEANDLAYLAAALPAVAAQYGDAADPYAQLRNKGTGGNAGFFNTFLASLYDQADPNRPMYVSPGDAVGCTVILAGAASVADMLKVANAFTRLFHPNASAGLASRLVPTPQNVRTTVIAAPAAKKMAVQISWDPAKPSFDTPYFPSASVRVQQYALIRSTSPKAMNARHVLDLFATADLVEGLTSIDADKSSQVIAIGAGTYNIYVDSSPLDPTKTYYYCVAWQVEVVEGTAETLLPWDLLSTVSKANMRRVPVGTRGTPPDWTAVGSAIDVIPTVSVVIRTLLAQVSAIGNRATSGPGAVVSAGLEALKANVQALTNRVIDINATIQRIAAMFKEELPALYATEFHGLGGVPYIVQELSRRLGDTSDTSRPPFDSNEYVLGVVIVAGGPRMPDIQAAVDLLGLLFGSPSVDSPLYTTLASMDGLINHLEERILRPDLVTPVLAPNGLPVDPGDPASSPQSVATYTAAGGNIDPATGLPVVVPAQVIANDGTGTTTSSPTNPNIGATNQPPTVQVPGSTSKGDPAISNPVICDPAPEDGSHKYRPV